MAYLLNALSTPADDALRIPLVCDTPMLMDLVKLSSSCGGDEAFWLCEVDLWDLLLMSRSDAVATSIASS